MVLRCPVDRFGTEAGIVSLRTECRTVPGRYRSMDRPGAHRDAGRSNQSPRIVRRRGLPRSRRHRWIGCSGAREVVAR